MNRSIQRPPTWRAAATPLGVVGGYAHTPSGVVSARTGTRRIRSRRSRGTHAAAIRSTCWPTSTVSSGTITVSFTSSARRGGGADSSSARTSGLSAVATPVAALSTVMRIGSVATEVSPWRTRTGPINTAPGCSARS